MKKCLVIDANGVVQNYIVTNDEEVQPIYPNHTIVEYQAPWGIGWEWTGDVAVDPDPPPPPPEPEPEPIPDNGQPHVIEN